MSDPDEPGGPGSPAARPGAPVTVSVADQQSVPVDGDALTRVAVRALDLLGMRGELSVALVDAVAMADLKGRYYGEAVATDVLSFPMDGPAGPTIGDVVVCPDVARRQARGLGIAFDDEMRNLLVHGIVHLSGRDHATPADEVAMAAEERRIMTAVLA